MVVLNIVGSGWNICQVVIAVSHLYQRRLSRKGCSLTSKRFPLTLCCIPKKTHAAKNKLTPLYLNMKKNVLSINTF